MPNHATTLVAAAIASAVSLTAQTTLVLPRDYDLAWGRGSSSALGGDSTRTQMIFAQPFPAGTRVLGIGLRQAASAVDRPGFTAEIEVRISSTPTTPHMASSIFTQNIGSDEIVALPRQIYSIPAMPADRSTGTFAQILFTTPFTFGTNNASNLNVELLVYSRSAGAVWSTDRAFDSSFGRATTAGLGCGPATIHSASQGGSYVGGSTISVSIQNAPPAALAMLLPSFDQKQFSPGVPLPFDLGQFGMPAGCTLMVNPRMGWTATTTDGNGGATLSVPVPFGFGQFGLGWQWIYGVDQSVANPSGFAATASRSTWVGPEFVVPTARYVWTLANVNALTGSSTADSVPIVQFLTQ